MKLEKISYQKGKKVKELFDGNYSDEYLKLNIMFLRMPNAWAFEERKFANGKTAISIKDKGNKIITQIKQL